MKKLITLLLALVCCLTAMGLVACNNTQKGKVGIKYYAEGSNIVSAMFAGEETIGLVPEPAVSNLVNKFSQQSRSIYKLDLQELYDSDAKAYPQAVMMVKSSLLNTHPEIINVLSQIDDNVAWLKQTGNASVGVDAIKAKFDASTLNADILSASAIDGCKIFWQSANYAKGQVQSYINDIISIENSSAKAVSDHFFYSGSASGVYNKQTISVYAPDGAPALSIAKFISEQTTLVDGLNASYNVIKANTIPAIYRGGTADVFILPVNLATKFYNTDENVSDPYVMVSVVTHGNFYIMSTEQLALADLKNKTIAVPNPNAVPDWTFRSTLKKHGLQFYNIEA